MKSLVELWVCLASDVEARVGADLAKDIKRVQARVNNEGDSFLTITLPAYCAHFERSLAEGRVSSDAFPGFGRGKAGYPLLFRGLLANVFTEDGTLRTFASVDCIRALRQLCLFAKKVERTCSDARLSAAVDAYVKCDSELVAPQGQLWRYFGMVADVVVESLTEVADPNSIGSLKPRHGPGGTQERILGNQKWRFVRWHRRLEDAGFTRQLYARGSSKEPSPEEGYVPPELVEPGAEAPVRVVFVPKTLKTPRVIAVEPVCMQFAQQALKRLLVRDLRKSCYTAGHVNFTDQTVNQRLALESSESGRLATIDMSEASDRVGLVHAERLFEKAPWFRTMALASRSTRAKLPDGREIVLRKFASMGSALCFPVEALTFFVGVIASRIRAAGEFPSRRTILEKGRDVYVYGDDLLFPSDEAPAICADLEALGFKVNGRKSFWTGKFRESCGVDAYAGELVTPIYLRSDLPTKRTDLSQLLSSVSTANQLSDAGYSRTATAIRSAVERTIGLLPNVPLGSAAVGWHGTALMGVRPPTRWNRQLQRSESLHLTVVPVKRPDPLDGDAALAKCLLGRGSSKGFNPLHIDPASEDHLERSAMRYAIRLKRSWLPNY